MHKKKYKQNESSHNYRKINVKKKNREIITKKIAK